MERQMHGKVIASLVMALGIAVTPSVIGGGQVETNPLKAALSAAPSAELPARAAQLVKSAKSSDRQQTAIKVIDTSYQVNPAALPVVVGSIAKASPEVAPAAAAHAATLAPKDAVLISKAAAGAAPSQAAKIVLAVCRAVPNQYRNIAVAVAEVAPGSSKDILSSVGAAFPELKPSIQRSVAGASTAPSVAVVLDTAQPVAATADTLSSATTPSTTVPRVYTRGPSAGGVYIPLGVTPTNITASSSGTSGRDYSAP